MSGPARRTCTAPLSLLATGDPHPIKLRGIAMALGRSDLLFPGLLGIHIGHFGGEYTTHLRGT